MSAQNSTPLPPDHRTVIYRTLCLGALTVRGAIESAMPLSSSPADAEAYDSLACRFTDWLNEQDFTSHFTLNELEALSCRPGAWNALEHGKHEARVEALGVLLWTLSLHEKLPSVNQSFAAPDLEAFLGWPPDAVLDATDPRLASFPYNGGDLIQGITQLRSGAAIKSERNGLDCWHWRVRVAELQRASTPLPNGQPYEMMIGMTAEEAHAAGAIARPVNNDFPLTGKAFSSCSESEQIQIGRIVAARRIALHWVSGYASEWDYVPERRAVSELLAA